MHMGNSCKNSRLLNDLPSLKLTAKAPETSIFSEDDPASLCLLSQWTLQQKGLNGLFSLLNMESPKV